MIPNSHKFNDNTNINFTMETINTRIHVFPRGERIDLSKVICIGALDKNISSGTFFIPVHVTGRNTPIEFNVGWAIGKVEETKKTEILVTIERFTAAWYAYLAMIEEKGGKNEK